MKLNSRLPLIFETAGPHQLKFKSPNSLKSMAFQTWIGLGILIGAYYLLDYFVECFKLGGMAHWSDIRTGAPTVFLASLGGLLPTVFFFILWLFVKPTSCLFDRAAQALLYESHKHKFSLPWSQVRFEARWFPSKTGVGGTEFFVLGDPPFPEGLLPKDSKKLHRFMERGGGAFNFGTFSVKDSDEAQCWVRFFTEYMQSQEPAEDLYRRLVAQRTVGSGISDLGRV